MWNKPTHKRQVTPLLESFSPLFYLCKWLGIYPHDLQIFQQQRILQKSNVGSAIVIVTMILMFIAFNLMLQMFRDTSYWMSQDHLSFIIGGLLSYIGLAALFADQLTAVRQQQQLGEVFVCINNVDEALHALDINVDNRQVQTHINLKIGVTVACEWIVCLSTYAMLVEHNRWAWLWVFSCLPTFYNSLDKIWFTGLLQALQQRFAVMNVALEQLVQQHEKIDRLTARRMSEQRVSVQYIQQDLPLKLAMSKNKVSPDFVHKMPKQPPAALVAPQVTHVSELDNPERVEEKFVEMCQLHSDLCDIAKMLNEIWSLPILFLMAYGFLFITASLYFLYSSANDQKVLSLYRNTEQLPIAVINLSYVAAKCTAVMFYSWKTTLESKRTGICMHKCAVVANTNKIYEIVNHLSLKLLNHGMDFSASEFFTLDMNTLFGICGGLTSYLIIFIQFDMAARQAKSAFASGGNATTTAPYNFTQLDL